MKKTILLADDDPSVRKMVARVLETAGYAVIQAPGLQGDGEALQADLILLDLKSPLEESWQKSEQVSRSNPLLPVIVMTAWPNQYEQAVRRGIDALMEKPLDLPLLLETIHDLLAESGADRTRRLESAA